MVRTVTLIMLDQDGEMLGALTPFETVQPWWQEASDVVPVVQERYGLEVDLLRLLSTEHVRAPGGEITYLAQARTPVRPELELDPVGPDLLALIERDEPLRAAYAWPGGPAASLAWAAEILGPLTAVQRRTWNLSAIWRLETERGVCWLKQLPAWLRCEPAALQWLSEAVPGLAPHVIALGDEGRELLADVPGVDHYEADLPTRLLIGRQAHRFQAAALTATDRLLADGVQDRRGPALTAWIRASLKGWVSVNGGEQGSEELLASLDERMAAVAECGLPDTLAHGDANPGNARGDGERVVFLDWSECYLGHPGFDILGLAGGLPADQERALLGAWSDRWRRQVPGCDPDRAIELLRPISALRAAAVYAEIIANIEPTEHRYHELDVLEMLAAAMADC